MAGNNLVPELSAQCTVQNSLSLIIIVRTFNSVFMLQVRNFLRDGPLKLCACLTMNVCIL